MWRLQLGIMGAELKNIYKIIEKARRAFEKAFKTIEKHENPIEKAMKSLEKACKIIGIH